MLFDQNTVGVCIIRDGEKYLLVKVDFCPKCSENVQKGKQVIENVAQCLVWLALDGYEQLKAHRSWIDGLHGSVDRMNKRIEKLEEIANE